MMGVTFATLASVDVRMVVICAADDPPRARVLIPAKLASRFLSFG